MALRASNKDDPRPMLRGTRLELLRERYVKTEMPVAVFEAMVADLFTRGVADDIVNEWDVYQRDVYLNLKSGHAPRQILKGGLTNLTEMWN